jgi:hypothetical protein
MTSEDSILKDKRIACNNNNNNNNKPGESDIHKAVKNGIAAALQQLGFETYIEAISESEDEGVIDVYAEKTDGTKVKVEVVKTHIPDWLVVKLNCKNENHKVFIKQIILRPATYHALMALKSKFEGIDDVLNKILDIYDKLDYKEQNDWHDNFDMDKYYYDYGTDGGIDDYVYVSNKQIKIKLETHGRLRKIRQKRRVSGQYGWIIAMLVGSYTERYYMKIARHSFYYYMFRSMISTHFYILLIFCIF